MADLGTIGIAIEVRGREALRQIESDMGIVDKTAKSAARSFEAFERAGLKTADTFRYMSDASKKRLAEEQKITQELIKQRSAAEQLARANAQKFQSQIGSNLGLGAQGISAGASAGAFEAEIERLRQKYDKIYVSSQLYERSLTELNKAHALGVLSTKQHESALESLNAEYQSFQNGTASITNRFAQNVQQNMAGVSNAGVLMQQLGYQAGDFIVQVQSGTNAFVAFGQQATQMVGFLPMLAQSMGRATVSVLGFNVAIAPLTLGLSIIIPLLTAAGAAFMRTGESGKKAGEGLTEYEQRIKSLDQSLLDYARTKEALAQGKTVDEMLGADALKTAQEDLQAAADTLDRLKKAQEGTSGTLGLLVGFFAESRDAVSSLAAAEEDHAAAKERVLEIERKMLDVYSEEYQSLSSRLQLEQARIKYGEDSYKVRELEAAAERKTYEASLRRAGLSPNLVAALMREYDTLVKSKNETEETRRQAETLRSVLEDLHGKEFRAKLVVSATLPDWVTGVSNRLSAIQGGFDPNNIPRPRAAPSMTHELNLPDAGAGSGGGGGAGITSVENKMEEIYRYLEQDKYLIEQEDIAYKQRQETLESSLQKKIITLEEYNQLEKDLKTKHEADLSAIEQRSWDGRLAEASGFFGSLASVVQGGGSKANKAYAAIAAVESTIDAYRAAIKAAAEAKTPWGRVAAYLSVLGTLMKGVSAIKSAGGSGGGGGGSVGSATVASSASAPAPQTVFISSLDPDGLYSGQALINLFDAFYDENDKRGKVFMVAR